MATFSGGDRLEAALAEIAKKLSTASELSVGFMADATYPDGTSVAMVAAIDEYGAPSRGIPPRPFFRTMIADNSPEWPDMLAAALRITDNDAAKALGQMGEVIKGQLQQSIIDVVSPPLSPVTVMLRGMRRNDSSLEVTGATVGEAAARVAAGKTNYGASDKPLIDTGVMLASVAAEVK